MIVSIYLVRLSLIHSNMPHNEFPSTKVSEITHLSDSDDRYPAWQHTDHKAQKLFLFVIFSGAGAGKRLFVRIRSQNLSWEPNKISFIMRWRHRRLHLMEKVSTSPDIELLYPVFCSECGHVAACQCWAATCRHSRYLVIRNICFKCVITSFFVSANVFPHFWVILKPPPCKHKISRQHCVNFITRTMSIH